MARMTGADLAEAIRLLEDETHTLDDDELVQLKVELLCLVVKVDEEVKERLG